jgi:5-methyltetrahydropteroyltriglutamate--homocysteine methyltransferase
MGTGGYDSVQEILFDRIKVHGYFMEYDTARSGSFTPLRRLPRDRFAVLGLVTTKTGGLESKDTIKRRLEEAARFADIDRLCLSPQCGFASTEEGNILAEAEEWAKLRMIVEVAEEVCGADAFRRPHQASG